MSRLEINQQSTKSWLKFRRILTCSMFVGGLLFVLKAAHIEINICSHLLKHNVATLFTDQCCCGYLVLLASRGSQQGTCIKDGLVDTKTNAIRRDEQCTW